MSLDASSGRRLVRIESVDGEFLYPLEESDFTVSGLQGSCRVLIADGILRVIDSDCPDKICQSLTPLKAIGDWTACLPNRVMISLIHDRSVVPPVERDLDTLSY